MADDLSNFFVPLVSGIIHVGANVDKNVSYMHDYHLKVLWVEPIPAFFRQLCVNIAGISGADGRQLSYHRIKMTKSTYSMLPATMVRVHLFWNGHSIGITGQTLIGRRC